MQYNLYQGAQASRYESTVDFIASLRHRNWLPAAVGGIMAFWVGLLCVNIMQQLPADTGAATKQPASHVRALVAQNASTNTGTSDGSLPMGRPTNTGSYTGNSQMVVVPSIPVATTVASTETDTPIIGGRGADEPVVPVETPTVTIPETPVIETPPVDPTPVEEIEPILPVLPVTPEVIDTVDNLLGL